MKHLLRATLLGACMAHGAWAQSSCSSDGQVTPVTLVEHFISADCEACWSAPPTVKPAARTLRLDWIVPGARGDEAPLSAAASRDALLRLEALGRAAPATSTTITKRVVAARANTLRVAHGVPLGGYIGASIALKTTLATRSPAHLSAWLLLVETIAAGTEDSPSERNLVRNVLLSAWDTPEKLSKTEQITFLESRPLSIPLGATPERLRVVGWVQDARGRVLSAAQSVCTPTN